MKAIGGFGTTIDVVLVNGRLKFGQTIVLTGTEGPIVTTVKALLTPSKMQDLRVKCGYTEHKELMAAQGVRPFSFGAPELLRFMRIAHFSLEKPAYVLLSGENRSSGVGEGDSWAHNEGR